jgi:hypothetical protein
MSHDGQRGNATSSLTHSNFRSVFGWDVKAPIPPAEHARAECYCKGVVQDNQGVVADPASGSLLRSSPTRCGCPLHTCWALNGPLARPIQTVARPQGLPRSGWAGIGTQQQLLLSVKQCLSNLAAGMASDAVIIDQQQPGDDPGSLARLFASADCAIERRRCACCCQCWSSTANCLQQSTLTARCCASCRTENIFKQLDERSLTEDEEKIIQQRVSVPVC